MKPEDLYAIIGVLSFLVPNLILLIASIYYAIKKTNSAGYLMTIGLFFLFVIQISRPIVFAAEGGSPKDIITLNAVISMLSGFCYLAFAIGFALLIRISLAPAPQHP